MSALHLYSLLEKYETRKQHANWQSNSLFTIDTTRNTAAAIQRKNSDIIDQEEIQIPFKIKPKKSTPNNNYQRHALPGTGRMAFGGQNDVSEIYQHYHTQNHTDHKKHSDFLEKFDLEEIKFSDLSIQDNMVSATTESSVSKGRKNKKNLTQEELESKKKQNTSNVEPKIISSTHKSSHNPPHSHSQTQAHSTDSKAKASTKPVSGLPSFQKTASNANNNPYGLNPKGPPLMTRGSGAPVVGVGQTTGKALAMAKMAALGEEWPEEEDLPGFAPTSQSLSSAGLPSKDAMKETNKSLHRQQKLNVAKRKV
jgi:DNA polymerase III alpha subunit (gram-positive type)